MERYFICSAIYSRGLRSITINYGVTHHSFPSNKALKDYVLNYRKADRPENIVILAVCEVSEQDYKSFWAE